MPTLDSPPSSRPNAIASEMFPPAFPAMPAPDATQLRKEYVAGGTWGWYGQMVRTLPVYIDDVTRDFGDDLYDRMLFDPQVSAVNTVFKTSILETGLNMTSRVRSRSDVDYDLAREIADEAERMLEDFEGTLDDVFWNLFDCVSYGNKVAESTFELTGSKKDGRKILNLKMLKVKERRATTFAVDQYSNLIGLLVRSPSGMSPVGSQYVFDPKEEPYNLISPQKFVVLNFKPKDSDIRGTSILRPAYSPWWRKQQIIPEYLRYISQFAGPSLIGYVAPEAGPQTDPANPTAAPITPEMVMLAALQQLRNGTAAAFPNGAKVDPIIMQGEGAAFLRALDHCDQQITKAVLTQELATEEGKHMARAAAEVHQDVLDTLVRQCKLAFADKVRDQLFRRWVKWNWGEHATHLAPKVGLGSTVLREQPALWSAVAQLAHSGYLTPSQFQPLDEKIGLPVRDEDEIELPLAAQASGEGAVGATPASTAADPAGKPKPGVETKPAIPGLVGVKPHLRALPKPKLSPDVQNSGGEDR